MVKYMAMFLYWLVTWLPPIIYFPIKAPIFRFLKADVHAKHLSFLHRLAVPVVWLAIFALTGIPQFFIIKALYAHSHESAQYIEGLIENLYLFTLLPASFLVAVGKWIEEVASSPDIQKRVAGHRAEEQVKKLIDSEICPRLDAIALHNSLFVFNENTDNEFSAEVDHIIVSSRNFYLIETKYKSGTIFADANEDAWVVRTAHGEGSMRNALNQAKNSSEILFKKCSLSVQPIPIVVIVGNNPNLVGNPSNVVTGDGLLRLIQAFERISESSSRADPSNIIAKLHAFINKDQFAYERHIERIQKRLDQVGRQRELNQDKEIVNAASIDKHRNL